MNDYTFEDPNVMNHILQVVEIMHIEHLDPKVKTPFKLIVKVLMYEFHTTSERLSLELKIHSDQIVNYILGFLSATNYEYDIAQLQLDEIRITGEIMEVEFLFKRSTQ